MDDKSQPTSVTGASIFQNLIKKIVKKVDNQSEVEFNQSTSLQQPQSIYTDQNQLTSLNYQQTGNVSQQSYSGEQYDQMQQSGFTMPATNYTNYYQPTVQSNSYLYTQTSAEFQSNYDSSQLSNLSAPLDLNQQTIYQQPNYTNYVQQTPAYYDQQWQNTPLHQQITPLSSAYQSQQFSFNQYTQDNQLVNIPYQPTDQQFIAQTSISGQVLNSQLNIGNPFASQLGNQLNEPSNVGQQPTPNQYSQQANLTQPQMDNQTQFNQSQMNANIQNVSMMPQPNAQTTPNISNPQNLQNISPSQLNRKTSKPVITSAAQGTIAPPLLNKIKQKMASHGNKMMTMIKASPTLDPNQKATNGSAIGNLDKQATLDTSRKASFCSPVVQNQSSLNTEELTAHLTDEEKQILAKVFQKEEEFQRETSGRGPLLNITLSGNVQQQSSRTSSPAMDGTVLATSTITSLGISSIGNCRTCLKRINETEEHHYCDNCSQIICEDCSSYSGKHQAKQWWCSYCRRRGTQPCLAAGFEDAIELSSPKFSQHQRRRFTMLPGVNENVDLPQGSDSNRIRSRSRTPSRRSRRPSLADTRGRQSSLDLPQPIDNDEQLNQDTATCDTFKSLENDSLGIKEPKSADQVDQRTGSFERSNDGEHYNSQARASIQIHSIQKINNQLLQRRRSSISKRPLGQRPSLTTPAPIALPRTLDSGCTSREQLLTAGKLPRKSYSASDSSLDEILDPTFETSNADAEMQSCNSGLINQISPHPSDEEEETSNLAGSTRLSRSVHQLSTGRRSSRRSNESPLASQKQLNVQQQIKTTQYNIPVIHTTNEIYPTNTESTLSFGKSNSSTMLRNTSSSSSIRRPTSANVRKQSAYFTYESSESNQQSNQQQQSDTSQTVGQLQQINLSSTQTTTIRRQSDSQGSEGSEPVDNSLSLSSPDYSRSPRQSADSDILGLPSMSPLSSQRRSIPSVLVDTADPNHLTSRDALNRRNSSTGRVLPTLPKVEQSRSLLELPGKFTCSTHSLDLPNPDQPRRASAPEGENIKIVIDDFGDERNFQNFQQGSKRKQIERVILHRDQTENRSVRSQGFGLCVCGGKLNPQDNQLYAIVAWVLPGGPADKMSVKQTDTILQWNGQSLINMSYEQVANLITNSGDQAELLIEPYIRDEKKSSTVHQKRRLSQGVPTTLNSLSATSIELKSGSGKSNSSSVYASGTLPVQQATIQQQPNQSAQLTTSSQFVQANSSQSNQVPTTTSASNTSSNLTSLANRRKLPQLPRTPDNQQQTSGASNKPTNQINLPPQNKVSQVLIECSLDADRRELVVSLICAQLPRTSINTFCYGQVRILPNLGFSSCKTELSKTMEWNETLIFKSFPVEKIPEMALEIGVWEQDVVSVQQTHQKQTNNLLGETVIPLDSAIYSSSNKSEWWPLLSVPSFNQLLNAPVKTTPSNFASIASSKHQLLTTNQLQDRCVSAEYLPMNQFLDNKLDTKHLITESRSVPSSRRNSGQMNAGHSAAAFTLQPNVHHNLSANVLNSNQTNTSSQMMNRRPSSSTTAIVSTSNQYQTLNFGNMSSKTASASVINVTKPPDHLSSSANHLTLDPTLTTNTIGKHFLDVNNNSKAYNSLRRKSSSAISNAPRVNRTLSLRSNSTNETELINAPSNLRETGSVFEQMNSIQTQSSLPIQQMEQSIMQQQIINLPAHQFTPQQNSLQTDQFSTLTRKASIQMASIPMRSNAMMKSMTDVDKQIDKQYTSIVSALATPLRRPLSSTSTTSNQMQPRCISAMDTLRRRPLSISANSCSSSEELTDTECMSKAGPNSKNEVDNCIRTGKIIGQIKLTIVMTKCLLEIDILEAKLDSIKLQYPNKPDTYVKCYLKEDGKRLNKKKTKIVPNSYEPQYKHLIKYNASMAINRTLLVMLWQKQKGFQSSNAIGVVEIAINQMDLNTKATTDWYNLYEINLKEKQKLLRQQSDIV